MKNKKNILILANELQYTCGVTNSLYNFLAHFDFREFGEITVLCGGGDNIDKFRKLGVEIYADRNLLHQQRNLLRYLIAHYKVWKIIWKKKIKVVHSHHFYHASIAWNISRIKNIRTVLTLHGIIPDVGKVDHYLAEKIIAVNEHIYNYLIENRIKKTEQISLIRNCLPECSLKAPAAAGEKIRFLAASRIEHDKGLDIFVEAVALLPVEYLKKSDFMIAGRGSCLPDILNLIERNGSRVQYIGNLKNLDDTLINNHVFVMPSRSRTEGFPMTVTEAALYGNLVVSSKFWGADSLLVNMKNAVLFNSDDPVDLSIKIMEIVDNHLSFADISEKLRSEVRKLYDPVQNSETLKGFYLSL